MRSRDTALLGDYESSCAGLKNDKRMIKEPVHAKPLNRELIVEYVN